MIIFLDKSLVASLNDDVKNHNVIIGALSICAQQAREGVHLLLGDRSTFESLEPHYSKMDARTIATLRRSNEKLTLRKQLRDFVTRAIRLVSDDVVQTPIRRILGSREEIILPASAVDNASSLVGKPILMVENLNDGHAYLKLAQSIASEDIFPGLEWLSKMPLCCEIAPGGGNTLAQLFAYQRNLESRIGIAIADGDYRYAGGQMGETAKSLQRVAMSKPQSPLLETTVLRVRTIENCLPRAEISRIASELDPIQVYRFARIEALFANSAFWGVVPIKSGVRCIELEQSSAESMFWTALFGGRRCALSDVCLRKRDCKNFVLPPISDKLLVKSISSNSPWSVTANCVSGVADVWHLLLVTIYSLFCGAERTATI